MRSADTYRGARRNAERGTVWTGIMAPYRPDPPPAGKTYKPNGSQEMWRRRKRMIKQQGAS